MRYLMQGLGLQTKTTRNTEDIISGQVASTELPQARERLPSVHDTPVIYENHLKTTRGVVVVEEFEKRRCHCVRFLTIPGVSFTHNSFSGRRSSVVSCRCAAYHR